ncbi:MAG: NAD(P)-dependent oxidoreductase [Polyangiaceae bacterium]
MIAFFGMGLLGSNFVRALRRRGEEVRVWNRTPSRATALEETGARAFEDPSAAARGATRIHLTLSDDAAVDDVLERARPGIGPGALILDHTTTSALGAANRVAHWRQRGVDFVHAPVFMGPQNAHDGTGIMLLSGEEALVARARPILEPMTGKVQELGPRPDAAAAFKLLGNLFLMFVHMGCAEVLALSSALGVPHADALELFAFFKPGAAVEPRVKRMIEGRFDAPSWELAMARKDARLMLEAAASAEVELPVLPAIAARMDALIADGEGARDWTVVAKESVARDIHARRR